MKLRCYYCGIFREDNPDNKVKCDNCGETRWQIRQQAWESMLLHFLTEWRVEE